jgi:hypothetical protein
MAQLTSIKKQKTNNNQAPDLKDQTVWDFSN